MLPDELIVKTKNCSMESYAFFYPLKIMVIKSLKLDCNNDFEIRLSAKSSKHTSHFTF